MKAAARFPAVLLSLALGAGLASESLPGPLHMAVSAIKQASPPILMNEYVIFTSGLPARSVGLAFMHEGFRTIHQMQANAHGVRFLVYALPLASHEPLRYRMVVDGAWMRDPLNSAYVRDQDTGLFLSILEYPPVSDESPGVYRILNGRRASFLYRGPPGRRVGLAGSFNDWDPFMHYLEETEPGLYRLDIDLPPGTQRYVFVLDGDMLTDPLNPESAYSRDGLRVSVLNVP